MTMWKPWRTSGNVTSKWQKLYLRSWAAMVSCSLWTSGDGLGSCGALKPSSNVAFAASYRLAVILAAATRAPDLASTMLSAMLQEHERGLGGWHAEWDASRALPAHLRRGRTHGPNGGPAPHRSGRHSTQPQYPGGRNHGGASHHAPGGQHRPSSHSPPSRAGLPRSPRAGPHAA